MKLDSRGVWAALDLLLEEVEIVIDEVSKDAARKAEAQDFVGARESIEQAEALTAYRESIVRTQKEGQTLFPKSNPEKVLSGESRGYSKLKKGLRTPQDAYYEPILHVLQMLGGSAPMKEVLEKVEERMSCILKDVDYEPLNTDPASIRWRNSAQWARHALVKEGRLKADSPRGIWELALGKKTCDS